MQRHAICACVLGASILELDKFDRLCLPSVTFSRRYTTSRTPQGSCCFCKDGETGPFRFAQELLSSLMSSRWLCRLPLLRHGMRDATYLRTPILPTDVCLETYR